MSDVLVRILRPLRPPLEARGAELDAVMADHGLAPRRLWLDPVSRIPWDTFAEILEAAADRLGGPEALDGVAAERVAGSWKALAALVSRYVTPYPAYQLGVRWFAPAIFGCVRAELKEVPGGLFERVFIPAERRDSLEFFWLTHGVMRRLPTLMGWQTTSIEFVPRVRQADYRLRFAPAHADRGFAAEGPAAADVEDDLDELTALQLAAGNFVRPDDFDRSAPLPVSVQLRRLLQEQDPSRPFSLADAARCLAMSVRSLERSLAGEGTSFRTLRDAIRFERACTLLRRGESVDAVADQLGFLDPTSFHRAFRRWTGGSPGAFRRSPPGDANGGIRQKSGAPGHSGNLL